MLRFEILQDAVDAASSDSMWGCRSNITRLLQKGSCGYQDYSCVVAQFFDGSDLLLMAADEDGVPDVDLRAKALLSRSQLASRLGGVPLQ